MGVSLTVRFDAASKRAFGGNPLKPTKSVARLEIEEENSSLFDTLKVSSQIVSNQPYLGYQLNKYSKMITSSLLMGFVYSFARLVCNILRPFVAEPAGDRRKRFVTTHRLYNNKHSVRWVDYVCQVFRRNAILGWG